VVIVFKKIINKAMYRQVAYHVRLNAINRVNWRKSRLFCRYRHQNGL